MCSNGMVSLEVKKDKSLSYDWKHVYVIEVYKLNFSEENITLINFWNLNDFNFVIKFVYKKLNTFYKLTTHFFVSNFTE